MSADKINRGVDMSENLRAGDDDDHGEGEGKQELLDLCQDIADAIDGRPPRLALEALLNLLVDTIKIQCKEPEEMAKDVAVYLVKSVRSEPSKQVLLRFDRRSYS